MVRKEIREVWIDSDGVVHDSEEKANKAESDIAHTKAIDDLEGILNYGDPHYDYSITEAAKMLIINADVVIDRLLPYSIKHKEYADACGNRSEPDS